MFILDILYMTKILSFLKLIFHASIIFLIIISLFPGSLLGFLFYGDIGKEPNLIDNPFGSTINHFIYYIYVSLLGFTIYLKDKKFQILFYSIFALSIVLEVVQYFVPNRTFQLNDLIGNILGVLIAYSVVKIYLFLSKL